MDTFGRSSWHATPISYAWRTLRLLSTGTIIILLLKCLTGAALLFTTSAEANSIPGLYNTGVDNSGTPLAVGVNDPHYKVIAAPAGVTLGSSIVSSLPAWVATGTTSAWVSPSTTNPPYGPGGTYYYEISFDLTGFSTGTASISGRWATDNNGVGIFLNGVQVGSFTTPFGSFDWNLFTIPASSNYLPGVNKLVFRVNNGGTSSPTSLRVELSGQADTAGSTVGVNKDLKNNTGQIANDIEILLQGSYPTVYHYDGYPANRFSTFTNTLLSSGNTHLRWSNPNNDVQPGAIAHPGFLVPGAEVTILGVFWTRDGVTTGCAHQVSTNTHQIGTPGGKVYYKNNGLACASTPRYVGGLSVEWHANEVPLADLNATSVRTPIRTDVIADAPMLLQPGAEGSVNIPLAPANARFAVLIHKVSSNASLSGPDVTADFLQFPVITTLHVAGSSSVRDSFARMMASYCNAAFARNVFEFGPAGGGDKNYRAYDCTFHTSASSPAVSPEITAKGLNGKRVLVYHTVEVSPALGGSIMGVMPVYRGIPVEFVTVTNACNNEIGANAFDPITGFKRWTCNSKHAQQPNIGVSDTNPESFVTVNLAGADVVVNAAIPSLATAGLVNKWKSGLNAKELALGESKSMFAVGFGIAATKFAKTSGLTNLTHSQVASLLAGNVADWSQVNSSLSGPVKICRRTQGSGTQASFNAMFNSNPCLDPVGASQPVADGTTPGVIESSATSGVKTCLEAANTANEIAIGIVSLENNEVATGWEFIDLNGVKVFDTVSDVIDGVNDRIREDRIADGSYPYYQEATMQWLKVGVNGVCVDDPESAVANDAPHAAAAGLPFCHAGEIHLAPTSNNGDTGDVPSGDLLKLVELIRDNAGNPEITKNTVLTQNLPGVLSTPVWWTVPPYDVARFTPTELSQGISNYTRGGNFCKPSAYSP